MLENNTLGEVYFKNGQYEIVKEGHGRHGIRIMNMPKMGIF